MTTANVNVTVTTAGIVCSPNPVIISATDTLIAFNLVSAGFHFPTSNAIVITDPGSTFPYDPWTINATTAAVMDNCSNLGDWNYTVTVVMNSTGESISVDPVIRNTNLRAD